MFALRNLAKTVRFFGLKRPFPNPNINLLYISSYRRFTTSQDSSHKGSNDASNEDPLSKIDKGLSFIQQKNLASGFENLRQGLEIFGESDIKARLSKDELALFVRAYHELGKIYEKHHDVAESLKQYTAGLELAEKGGVTDNFDLGCLNNALARICLKQGKLDEAINYLNKATEVFQKIDKTQQPVEISTQMVENAYMMAVVYGNNGEVDKALELLEKILEKYEKHDQLQAGDLDLSLVYQSIGNMYISKGNVNVALNHWNRGLERSISKFGENSMQTLNFYLNVAQGLLQKQQFKEALKYAEKNYAICKEIFDENHPKIAESLLMLGIINFQIDNYDKAIESYLGATKVLSQYPEQYHDQISFAYLTLAEIHLIQKRIEEAREYFDKALMIAVRALGEDHPKVASYYLFWGELLKHRTDNLKGAKVYYQKGLDMYLKSGGLDEARLIDIYYEIGVLSFHDKDLEDALKNLHECLTRSQKVASKTKPLQDIYNFIGSIYFQQNKYKESIPYFEKAVEICSKSETPLKDLDIYCRNLGLSYEHNGNNEKAVECYQRALEIAFKDRGQKNEITQSHVSLVFGTLEKLNRQEDIQKLQKRFGIDISSVKK